MNQNDFYTQEHSLDRNGKVQYSATPALLASHGTNLEKSKESPAYNEIPSK